MKTIIDRTHQIGDAAVSVTALFSEVRDPDEGVSIDQITFVEGRDDRRPILSIGVYPESLLWWTYPSPRIRIEGKTLIGEYRRPIGLSNGWFLKWTARNDEANQETVYYFSLTNGVSHTADFSLRPQETSVFAPGAAPAPEFIRSELSRSI